MGRGASETSLPKAVFAALPADPDQQLAVAQQITQLAVSGRVAKLEAETTSLRQRVAEKDVVITGLQARVVGAELKVAETAAKLAVALQGQAKLIEDKDVLSGQVKKLMCQVSKLDDFKKALMKSLETSTECGDSMGAGEKPTPSSSEASRATPFGSLPASPMSKSTTPPTPIARKQQGQFSCMMLEDHDQKVPSKEEGSNGEASNATKSPQIDGKEFFRQARNQFSYEQFSKLLTTIKELNSHQQVKALNAQRMGVFHPIIYSCNTHIPPNCGEWVLAMPS